MPTRHAPIVWSLALACSAAGPAAWTPVPIVTAQQRAAGVTVGGEGGQWPRGPVATSARDPSLLLLPIDVGGVYRSVDGGRHWAVSMAGWNARGANAFAVSPTDADHVLGVGGNSMSWDPHWGPSPNGVYRSADRGATWRQVLARPDGVGGAVAWDSAGRRCYYLSNAGDLFRSDDGGGTWARTAAGVATPPASDWTAGGTTPAMLAADGRGTVWAAGTVGVGRSADGGVTFARVRAEPTFGLSLAPDGTAYACGADGVAACRDGRSFAPLASRGLSGTIRGVTVSPADPRELLCWAARPNWDWPRFVSHDGGAAWQPVSVDRSGSPLPCNARQGYAAWSVADPAVAWSLGGDWVTRSDDGGRSFRWSNAGYGGAMLGGHLNFSPGHPGLLLAGFQDYNAAGTVDGGHTWRVHDASGKGWGGHEYGGFALSAEVMWAGDADGWGSPRHLRVTRDGGRTWAGVRGDDGRPVTLARTDIGCGDPTDGAVGFAADWRTADAGLTWHRMAGCDGAFTTGGRSVYGLRGRGVVRSDDHGLTWRPATAAADGDVSDVAVAADRVYAAVGGDHLSAWDGHAWHRVETPADQYGHVRVTAVAADPARPGVLYVGGPADLYASAATVCRSADGGRTWTNLTVGTGGPHEVSAIRVDPATGDAWAAGQCFGLWRIGPPSAGDPPGRPAAAASAPRQPPVPTGPSRS